MQPQLDDFMKNSTYLTKSKQFILKFLPLSGGLLALPSYELQHPIGLKQDNHLALNTDTSTLGHKLETATTQGRYHYICMLIWRRATG